MLSLTGSVKTCKVDQGWADRIQSDRFQNPSLMLCPNWKGVDLTNRPVSYDSFYTKSAGCNLASDRVTVENYLRPQYMTYINLDARGFHDDSVETGVEQCNDPTNLECYQAGLRTLDVFENTPVKTGNFGENPSGANITARCPTYKLELSEDLAKQNTASRQRQATEHYFKGSQYNQQAGF